MPQPPLRLARTFEELARTGRTLPQADSLLGFEFLHAPLGVPHRDATTHGSAAGSADRLQLEPAESGAALQHWQGAAEGRTHHVCLAPVSTACISVASACPAAPVDWSLKTTVRFSSPTPFTIADEAALLGGGAVVQAQRAAACGEGLHTLSMQQRYLAALHSWQFPADPWQATVASAAKLRAPPPEVARRRADWQGAFASLYDALRCGACDAFYYLSPEASRASCAGSNACVRCSAGAEGLCMESGLILQRATHGDTRPLPCAGQQEAVCRVLRRSRHRRASPPPRPAHPLHLGAACAACGGARAGL